MTDPRPAPAGAGEQLRLMCVHAHPDDESSKGAATMAKYVREGVDVLVVTLTGGERGSVLNPAMDRPDVWRDMSEIRRREMDKAREILGVRQAWLGYVDSGLPDGYGELGEDERLALLPEGCFGRAPFEDAVRDLVRVMREQRPHVVTTYDENGGYPHPDHIRCHQVTVAAFEAAGDPERFPEAGEPWQPLKLYYDVTFSRRRLEIFNEKMIEMGLEPPYADWLEQMKERPDNSWRITTQVPCAEYFPLRDEALIAHATQVDPTGRWFACPLQVQQEAWPTEDFQLARSLVDTDLPEDDLFAGVRAPVGSQA